MSLRGNNAHFLSARVISHQSFNSSYDRVYFQPDGTILKCFKWIGRGEDEPAVEMEPNDEVRAAVETAISKPILAIGVNCKLQTDGDEEYFDTGSPYVIISGIIKGDMAMLRQAYFSEHTTDDRGMGTKICKEFPVRPEDEKWLDKLITVWKSTLLISKN